MIDEQKQDAEQATTCEEHPLDLSHTLYVIFHGSIAFYDDRYLPWIDAFVSDMKDEHVYRCGKFLNEFTIPRGSDLSLSGVTPGSDSLSNYVDRFVHVPGAKVKVDASYSRLRFPRPKKIWHCVNFKKPNDPKKICIVTAFQYDFRLVDRLRLRMFLDVGRSRCHSGKPSTRPECFPWDPTASDKTPLTLHIYAEEEAGLHERQRDLEVTCDLLGHAVSIDPSEYTERPQGEVPPGLEARAPWEINLSLSRRAAWLAEVGSLIQDHPPVFGNRFTIPSPRPAHDDNPSCGQLPGGSRG
jgi:hypothetical protein